MELTDIRRVWPAVRAELEALRARHPNLEWIPEDVYAACVHGHASLYTGPEGFIVLKDIADAHTGENVLWVWIACGRGIVPIQSKLDEFARSRGYKRLRMRSPRPGWKRINGWTPIETTFERTL